MTPQELKTQCEKLWRDPLLEPSNRVEFFAICGELSWKSGAETNPSNGKAAISFIRKCTKHYWPAFPEKTSEIYISKELRARYKKNFPRNYKYLLEAYGRTRTKYDAPLPGEIWHKGKHNPAFDPTEGTLVHWARGLRTQRRLERAKNRAALHAARSPETTVNRLAAQLRDLFGTPLTT